MGALTEQDAKMLAKILGRLGSDFDGERAAAGAIAWRFIRERKLSWDEVLAPSLSDSGQYQSYSETPRPSRSDWRQLAKHCLEVGDDGYLITDWERGFLTNILRWWRPLTDKQWAVLNRIAVKVGAMP
jgi:hypothetical protein